MHKFTIAIIIIVASFAGISAIQKEDGRAGATGSPGETTCNTSQCHVGNPVNNGAGSIVISAPTMASWQYIPGQVYPISVTVSRTGSPLFGLGFEALKASGANGGALSITNPSQTQIKSAVVGGNVRANVVHQLNGGLTANTHTFTFNWTAPATGIGPITFYSAGNAANDNGMASGDFIYTTSQIVTESTAGLESISDRYLTSVYPNPANATFNLGFELTEPSLVIIKLIDVQGKIVSELVSETLASGNHEIRNSADQQFAPGLYFVHFTINDQQSVKRLIVL